MNFERNWALTKVHVQLTDMVRVENPNFDPDFGIKLYKGLVTFEVTNLVK
jgi:hypothetical protein